MRTTLTGGCHCGAIGVALEIDGDAGALSPRHCGCDFCRRHGGLYLSSPTARLDISIRSDDAVSRYSFGHETAEFLVCKTCGAMAAATCEIDGRLRAVLNANMLEPALAIDEATVPVADYEAEDVAGRLDRRAQRWIGTVTVNVADRVG